MAADRVVSKIGATFHRIAMGPLSYASTLLTANQVSNALTELAPQSLADSYQRGLAEVADLVGVPKGEVDRLMPLGEFEATLERLRFSHHRAELAWKAHAGQFGVFDMMTALTADGRAPDIAECLSRIASKVRADKELAEPLGALAQDATSWIDLLTRSRFVLEDRSWLAAAYRRRRIIRTVVLLTPVLGLFAFTVGVVYLRFERDAIDSILANEDTCAAERLDDAALRLATTEQKDAQKRRVLACQTERAAAAQRELEAAEKARLEAEAQARKQAHEAACATLAASVLSGTLSDADKRAAGNHGPFMLRLAAGSLEPADIGPKDPSFPCADTQAHSLLEKSFTEALFADVSVWTRRGDPGPLAKKALLANKARVTQNAQLGLADNAERIARTGLTGGNAEVLARAGNLCTLTAELGMPGRGSCDAVLRLKP